LGDSDFALDILAKADEKYDRYYELKSLGYDLKSVEQKVSEIYEIEPEDIYSRGREKIRVEARSLFCYWAVRELGYALTNLARRLGMSQPGVGYAVSRGERIAKRNNYQLLE
jgi:chromosomal replication initiation ATPase DnaA